MPPTAGVAALFVDRDYAGASATLTAGSYNIERLAARDSVGNDTVSSLQVAPGYTVTVYTDANFQGASKTFTRDAGYVGDDFNDQISSVTVTATGSPASPPSSSPGVQFHGPGGIQPPSPEEVAAQVRTNS